MSERKKLWHNAVEKAAELHMALLAIMRLERKAKNPYVKAYAKHARTAHVLHVALAGINTFLSS